MRLGTSLTAISWQLAELVSSRNIKKENILGPYHWCETAYEQDEGVLMRQKSGGRRVWDIMVVVLSDKDDLEDGMWV